LLGVLAWRTDWHQVGDAFYRLHVEWWLAAAALYALTQLVSSLRWQLLARPLGFHLPLRRYLSIYYIGMFFNLVLPTSVGGDVVRAWYLDGKSGRRVDAFVSVIADRVSGVVILLLLALFALPFRPPAIPAWMTWAVLGMTTGALFALLSLYAFSRRQADRASFQSAEDEFAEGADKGWAARFRKLQMAMTSLHRAIFPNRQTFLLTTLLSLVVQLANVLVVWFIGHALHLSIPTGYYLILVPTVTLLTLLPVSLNGMGVREGGTAILLAPLGVDTGTAMTLALLWFAAYVLPSCFGVIPYLSGRMPRYQEGKPAEQALPAERPVLAGTLASVSSCEV
jgi:uncharacterized protein (TIRG00374 family)